MKKGVTLITLIITIIVILIILSTVSISASSIIDNSKKTSYAKDLSSVEEAIKSEYNTTGKLPVIDDLEYSLEKIKSMVKDTEDILKLVSEIEIQNDSDSIFYSVDLSKIGIKRSKRGIQKNGNQNDIYVVSNNLNVYYPIGVKISGETYFSLTPALINKTKVAKLNTSVSGDPSVVFENGIKLSKNKSIWTNEIIITIETDKNEGDIIKYSIAGQLESIITSNTLIISFPDHLKYYEHNAIIAGPIENNKVVVTRYDSSLKKIAAATISIRNLDIVRPNLYYIVPTIESKPNENILTFPNIPDASGIKELRYEYKTKLNVNGDYQPVYSPQPYISWQYLKNFGKKSKNSNQISLPKNIRIILVTCIDNAGNSYDSFKTYTIPDEYLLKEESYMGKEAKLPKGWNSKAVKAIYAKNGDETNLVTIPVPIGFKMSSVPSEQDINTGIVIYEGNEPVTTSNIEIAKQTRNQFVWVQVSDTVPYERWCDKTFASNSPDLESLAGNVTSETEQITRYGGFYIARYEAGIPENLTNAINNASQEARDISGIPVSVKNAVPWNHISYMNAKYNSNNTYNNWENNLYIQSTLVTGLMWDTATKWIEVKTGLSATYSVDWGNYLNAPVNNITQYSKDGGGSWLNTSNTTKSKTTNWLLKTGHTDYTKANNIYDMAGNIGEFVNEINESKYYVYVGGSAANPGGYNPAIYRYNRILSEFTNQGFIGYRE